MNILDKILKTKQEEVARLKKIFSFSDFEQSPCFQKISFSMINEIKNDKNISIIAEIKKASPSKGILRKDFNHLQIAQTYLNNNINSISVLTDKKYFLGNINFLHDIAGIKTKPILRKDFIIDSYQIYEAKANGADAILLIAEALTKSQIKDLTQTAVQIGLEVLLEIHSGKQLDKIDFTLNRLIGINNRNLETFETSIVSTISLAEIIPDDILLVSESGIHSQNDINKLKEAQIDAVLVGEFFMKTDNIEDNINELRNWCKIES